MYRDNLYNIISIYDQPACQMTCNFFVYQQTTLNFVLQQKIVITYLSPNYKL